MMQEEPEFEARIGDREPVFGISCHDPRLREIGVTVHVENAPYRLILEEVVIHALGVRKRLLLSLLRGPNPARRLYQTPGDHGLIESDLGPMRAAI
jgi:hypothetical protein